MEAVILAAGKGTRLHPLTNTIIKPLFPLLGRPLLCHILDAFTEEITQVIIVINDEAYQLKQKLTQFNYEFDIDCVVQEEQHGTGHAVSLCENLITQDHFYMMYGDIFTSSKTIKDIINLGHSIGFNNGIFAAFEARNPERYGCLRFSDNNLIEIQEKEPNPSSNKINAGIMVLPRTIFEILKNTPESPRGEIELTDAVNQLIKSESNLALYHIKDYWIDIGYPWNILEANETGMRHDTFPKTNLSLPGVTIEGNIKIADTATLRPGTFIQGPVIVEENAILGPNCFIRPYSFIGKNVRIGNGVEIKNSIILDNTIIGHLSYIGDSVIGKECNFGAGTKVANLKLKDEHISMIINGERISSGRKKLGVFMGDNVKTGINVSLMPGITIGENSSIGAHTLVSRNIPSNSLLYKDPDKSLIQKSHNDSGTNLDE